MNDIKLRAKFKEPALEEKFKKDGYVIIQNFANEEQVIKMKAIFDEFYEAPKSRTNLLNTLMINEEDKNQINEKLMEQLLPSIKNHFYDYVSTYYYFLTKPVDEESIDLPMHSDSSAVNENKYEYVVIWLPLIDVDKNNGCMYMIPSSQKLFTYSQPFCVDWPYTQLTKQLKEYAVDLPLRAGDLLIFSPKTIHGSYPNRSSIPRPVVGSGLVHPDSEMYFHHFNTNSNQVTIYEVDFWFYFRNQFGEPEKGKYPIKGTHLFNPPEITPKILEQFFKENDVKKKSKFHFFKKFGFDF